MLKKEIKKEERKKERKKERKEERTEERKCIRLVLDRLSYKYQLGPSCLMCHLKLVFPYLFLFWMICQLLNLGF